MTVLTRRAFLAGLAGMAGIAFAPAQAHDGAGVRYLGAARCEKSHVVRAFDREGRVRYTVPLPWRGHGFAHHHGHCVAMARRPGSFARVFDAASGQVLQDFSAPPGRHFYGHALFVSDGAYLLTSENNIADGRGVIGIRDAKQGYALIGEISSHGIGPHEIACLPGSDTLVVANGGIRTDPAFGREKLNLGTMTPSLAYIDLASGKLLDEWRLPEELHRLSLRHIAVDAQGGVAIAMQFEGGRDRQVPLVGWHAGGDAIELLRAPPAIERRMRQYCGSVCLSEGGRHIRGRSRRHDAARRAGPRDLPVG